MALDELVTWASVLVANTTNEIVTVCHFAVGSVIERIATKWVTQCHYLQHVLSTAQLRTTCCV